MRNCLRIYSIFLCLLFPFFWCNGQVQSYEELIGKSYDFMEKDSLDAAEVCLIAAMRLEPGNRYNYALLTNLGTIQRQLGKLDEALISYTAALSRQPNNALILSNRASLYQEMGDTENALTDYNTLLAKEPNRMEALYSRGILYIKEKNFLSAEADFQHMLEISDKSNKARLGYAILEKMRGNYKESEDIFEYLIREEPKNIRLYEERAELYFMEGKNGRAMSDLEKVFQQNPDPGAEIYVLRGRVKLALYEKTAAANDFQKALKKGYNKTVINELIKLTE